MAVLASYIFSLKNINKLVNKLANTVAYNNPYVPSLNVTINSMFNIIVSTLKIKFDSEYIFIFPIPRDIELLNVINIHDII